MEAFMEAEKPHEACGIFGIYAPAGGQVVPDVYRGLLALQHRGQESAGISAADTKGPRGNIRTVKGMGLVSEVFSPEDLYELRGNIAAGHVRYSTREAACRRTRSRLR